MVLFYFSCEIILPTFNSPLPSQVLMDITEEPSTSPLQIKESF